MVHAVSPFLDLLVLELRDDRIASRAVQRDAHLLPMNAAAALSSRLVLDLHQVADDRGVVRRSTPAADHGRVLER